RDQGASANQQNSWAHADDQFFSVRCPPLLSGSPRLWLCQGTRVSKTPMAADSKWLSRTAPILTGDRVGYGYSAFATAFRSSNAGVVPGEEFTSLYFIN